MVLKKDLFYKSIKKPNEIVGEGEGDSKDTVESWPSELILAFRNIS
jgi:hypothetical protein